MEYRIRYVTRDVNLHLLLNKIVWRHWGKRQHHNITWKKIPFNDMNIRSHKRLRSSIYCPLGNYSSSRFNVYIYSCRVRQSGNYSDSWSNAFGTKRIKYLRRKKFNYLQKYPSIPWNRSECKKIYTQKYTLYT